MSLSELTRSTAFRIAAIFSGLFLLTVLAIFATLYALITHEIEHKIQTRILGIRDTLVLLNESSGFDALAKMIGRSGPTTTDAEDVYLLTDTNGKYVAGNVSAVPRFDDWEVLPWANLPLRGQAKKSPATQAMVALWTPVDGGYLLVGDGDGDIQEAQRVLIQAVGWGMLMTVVSGLFGGALLGWQAQQRISVMETALDAVARGEFSTRVPRTASGDDLDQVAARINKALDQLQGLIGTVRQVSSDIAHDLKTPIGRIRQRLETVHQSAATVSDYRDMTDKTLIELDGVIETFEALLRIAQIEGGARKARFTDVDLRDVLFNVADAYEVVGEDTNHRMSVRLPEGKGPVIKGDRELLTQLFSNVIENALRHCPAGSRIDLELQPDAGAPTVRIADNGPGIPEAERENVFRRLYRLEKSRTTPGSGLGLSMVAAIADLHGAKIELGDNKPGLVVKLSFSPLTLA
jgi:signal transduction histidine kinase